MKKRMTLEAVASLPATARESKGIVFLRGEKVDVGFDAHKKDYSATMWSERRQGVLSRWVQPADPEEAVRALKPFERRIGRVVYEAGLTGYSLARVLRKEGFNVDVIAASRTPKSTGRQAKSDGLDNRKLAAMAGLAPLVTRTGSTVHEGRLMKCGNPRPRKVLIEAAWRWVVKDSGAGQRYAELVRNTGERKKAIAAMARRLVIILWRISLTQEGYRPRALHEERAPTQETINKKGRQPGLTGKGKAPKARREKSRALAGNPQRPLARVAAGVVGRLPGKSPVTIRLTHDRIAGDLAKSLLLPCKLIGWVRLRFGGMWGIVPEHAVWAGAPRPTAGARAEREEPISSPLQGDRSPAAGAWGRFFCRASTG